MSGPSPTAPIAPAGSPPAWPPAPGPGYGSFPYPPPPPKKTDHTRLIIVIVVLVLVVPTVLGAILYVIVSGLLTGPGPAPKTIGMTISRSADQTNWTLLISSASGGLTTGGTFLTVRNAGGMIVLSAKAFDALTWGSDRAIYQGDGDSLVEVGESILLSATTYTQNYRVEITDGTQILFAGILA